MNNRQARGRGRGRNNNNRNNNRGGGGIDRENRIDNRARGNAAQMLDKYKKMAHDAQVNDDRVNAEYYLQFADHYFRVNADMQARREEQRIAREEAREEQRAANGQDRDDNRDSARDGDGDERDGRRGRPQRSRPQRDEQGDRDDQPEETGDEKKPVRARRSRKTDNGKAADKALNGDASEMSDEPKGLDAGVLPPAISISGDADADEVKVEKKPARKKRVVKPKATEASAEEGDAA